MVEEKIHAIGLMSGTSLDGVDLVYVCFSEENQFEILAIDTIKYTKAWFERLRSISEIDKESSLLKVLDVELGRYYGELISGFINSNHIKKIDFVASHGHTVHHQPEIGYTLQIGCGKEIYKRTGVKVVYDFRTQDVLLGGQGAPLVPIGDELLFSKYDYCLNLGGFSNVSFDDNGVRRAFDICPVNTILNYYANRLGFEYDAEGALAKKGVVDEKLLKELNSLVFYVLDKPKSLGVEFLNSSIFPLMNNYKIKEEDLLRTFVEHIAIQISAKLTNGTVLVTGGGVYNTFLLDRIRTLSKNLSLIIPSNEIIDYKEALVFALLGKLKLENSVNCLSSVTGALKNHSSGKIVF